MTDRTDRTIGVRDPATDPLSVGEGRGPRREREPAKGPTPGPSWDDRDGRVPFVLRIGVTGHRDLAHPRADKATLSALLDVLTEAVKRGAGSRGAYAHALTGVQFRLYSGLAEGADRVAAAAVQEHDEKVSHEAHEGRLVAVLPYRAEDFTRSDCHGSQSQKVLQALLARAHVAGWPDRARSEDDVDTSYDRVGREIVRSVDLLIALWDGQAARGKGGTAKVVEQAVWEGVPVVWVPVERAASSSGPALKPRCEGARLICRVPRKRLGGRLGRVPEAKDIEAYLAAPSRVPVDDEFEDLEESIRKAANLSPVTCSIDPDGFVLQPLLPTQVAALLHEHFECCENRLDILIAYSELERYNRTAHFRRRPFARSAATSVWSPGALQASENLSTSRRVVRQVSRWVEPYFLRADSLATGYQTRYRVINDLVYVLTVVAIASAAWTTIVFHDWLWCLWVDVAILGLLLVVVVTDVRAKFRSRWVHYRAMAEEFRISAYMTLLVNADEVRSQEPEFASLFELPGPGGGRQVPPWFARVVEEVWDRHPRDIHLHATDFEWVKGVLVYGWLVDQCQYHRERAKMHEQKHRRFHLAIMGIFGSTLALGIAHLTLSLMSGPQRPPDLTDRLISFAVVLFPALGAAVSTIASHREHRRHREHFRLMVLVLAPLIREVKELSQFSELLDRMASVRHVMLQEAYDWLEVMRARAYDAPT